MLLFRIQQENTKKTPQIFSYIHKMMDDNATYRQEIFLFVEQTIIRV